MVVTQREELALEHELRDATGALERYPQQLRSVTKEQVVDTARAFLPADRYALAVAGPELPR